MPIPRRSIPVLLVLLACGPQAPDVGRPDVLLLQTVGLESGAPGVHLDALRDEGVVFERAYAARLARFYELETNRPLYFTRDYDLTYDDADVPTHYSFAVSSRVDELRRTYAELASLPEDELVRPDEPPRVTPPMEREVRRIVEALDERGAWVTEGGMRYHDHAGPVIDMRTAVRNLETLADYLVAVED